MTKKNSKTVVPQDVVNMYSKEKKSVTEIAEFYGTYPNKILRIINKSGVKKRTRSEAQKIAIESGRKEPPNDGSPLSEERKNAISEGMADFWKTAPEEYIENHTQRAREQWENMSEADKDKMNKASRAGILKAAKEGSKVEVAIRELLESEGISYIRNHKGFLIDPALEVDIFIPAYKAAIEVDGVFHSEAIHGHEKLAKRKQTDRKKNGLLTREGYWPIRVDATKKNISKKDYRDLCSNIMETINNLSGTPKLITIKIK